MPKLPDSKKIRKVMEKTLDKKRYEHTLGVAYTAMNMASIYGEDIKKAELAGLLHDCAKNLDNAKMLKICKKHNLAVTDFELNHPFLLHSKVGGFLAAEEFGVDDADVINAILNHTTGRPGMSTLEKIIFIADYIEPNRKLIPGLFEARRLAFTDLDQAMICVLNNILNYLNSCNAEIDEKTGITYEYYLNKAEVIDGDH